MTIPVLAILAPILSISILTLGNGFYTTLTTIQVQHFASLGSLGFISSAYFVGMLLGSYFTQHLIIRIGHIRSFAIFAAVMTVCVLLQAVLNNPWLWATVRAVSGFGLAGLFVIIESWLLAHSQPNTKGRILALYLCVYYLVQTLSQLLLGLPFSNPLFAFILIAILSSLSVLPVALNRCAIPMPETPEHISLLYLLKAAPLGAMAALISGVVLGAIYTIQPYFLSLIGSSIQEIAYIMAATVLGGAICQWPVGKLSDRLDRRYMLFAVSFLLVALSISAVLINKHSFNLSLIICFLLGGLAFAIYPLGINLATDSVDSAKTTSSVAMLTVIYGVGSAIGPLLVTRLMSYAGAKGYFIFMIIILGILVLYSLRYLLRPDDKSQHEFMVAVPETAVMNEQIVEESHENHSISTTRVRSDQTHSTR
jgi:MFS family permease